MSIGKEAALLFAVLFLPGMVAQGSQIDSFAFESVYYNVQVLVVAVPQLLLVIYVSGRSSPGYEKTLGWKRPRLRDAGIAAATLCMLFVVMFGVAAIVRGGEPAFGGVVTSRIGSYWMAPLVLTTSVAVGYREEVFFRAYLLNRASEIGLHSALSIVLAALLFAVGHLYEGIGALAGTFGIGVVLGIVYLRFRSLHAIAWAHGIYNAVAILLSGVVVPT